jgi:NAD(P)-dependent dehydrogenase (short-subunit alcohol dehydrogenase family)
MTTYDECRTDFGVKGCTAIVTGGGAGLGRAIAFGIASAGGQVAIADVNETSADDTVTQIEAAGGRAIAVGCDVADHAAVAGLVERTEAELGPINALVNNAFVPVIGRPQDLTLDAWQRAMQVNLTGYFLCAQAVGRRMIAHGRGGAIVNISSIAGTSALGRGNFAYSVTKGGVVQMTRELAVEWAPHGVRVNTIQPCQFRTAGLEARLDHAGLNRDVLMQQFTSGIPIGRIGEPPDIVGPVVFLLSDAARIVTGVCLPVDGGNLALNAGGTIGE